MNPSIGVRVVPYPNRVTHSPRRLTQTCQIALSANSPATAKHISRKVTPTTNDISIPLVLIAYSTHRY